LAASPRLRRAIPRALRRVRPVASGVLHPSPGRGIIDNTHSADIEFSPPPPRVCRSIHPESMKSLPISVNKVRRQRHPLCVLCKASLECSMTLPPVPLLERAGGLDEDEARRPCASVYLRRSDARHLREHPAWDGGHPSPLNSALVRDTPHTPCHTTHTPLTHPSYTPHTPCSHPSYTLHPSLIHPTYTPHTTPVHPY
jgi:hypothetical protein